VGAIIEPLFSLTPLSPTVTTYDPANPTAPYGEAYFSTYGGYTDALPGRQLRDQYNNDEVILGFDAVPQSQPVFSGDDSPHRHCSLELYFRGVNVSTENQYLLLFSLRNIAGEPQAEFILGSEIVDTETITGSEQHALMFDCPGDDTWSRVIVRLASPYYASRLGFKGLDCVLL
jgi:hypothetical protein